MWSGRVPKHSVTAPRQAAGLRGGFGPAPGDMPREATFVGIIEPFQRALAHHATLRPLRCGDGIQSENLRQVGGAGFEAPLIPEDRDSGRYDIRKGGCGQGEIMGADLSREFAWHFRKRKAARLESAASRVVAVDLHNDGHSEVWPSSSEPSECIRREGSRGGAMGSGNTEGASGLR